jgi:hypothetical protein
VREPSWDKSVDFLTSLDRVPAALATGGLLNRARSWEGRVVPRTSMHDLLFTMPGEEYPFAHQLRVSWKDGAFEFWLLVRDSEVAREQVSADDADEALDRYLVRLVAAP